MQGVLIFLHYQQIFQQKNKHKFGKCTTASLISTFSTTVQYCIGKKKSNPNNYVENNNNNFPLQVLVKGK